jgi:hypothetical protein
MSRQVDAHMYGAVCSACSSALSFTRCNQRFNVTLAIERCVRGQTPLHNHNEVATPCLRTTGNQPSPISPGTRLQVRILLSDASFQRRAAASGAVVEGALGEGRVARKCTDRTGRVVEASLVLSVLAPVVRVYVRRARRRRPRARDESATDRRAVWCAACEADAGGGVAGVDVRREVRKGLPIAAQCTAMSESTSWQREARATGRLAPLTWDESS